MLKNRHLHLLSLLFFAAIALGQSRKRLPEPINLPDEIEYAPSISADGRVLVFQSSRYGIFVNANKKVPRINAEGNQMLIDDKESTEFFGIYEARRHPSGDWLPPTPIQSINRFDTGMTPLMGGPSVSYDGNTLFFFANYSSKRTGYGREDIYYSVRQRDTWSEPINIGPEINTAAYEGFPSISSDGKRLYFVRENLTKKGTTNQVCYSLMMSEKNREGKWKRPIELPEPVNMDCEKAPRIMADSRTLVYSSIKKSGKGDFDLYMTTFQEDGTWSEPKALDFINTKRSDQHVAISACGDLMYYVSDGDIYTIPVPEALRPFKMATVQGFVVDSLTGKSIQTRIVVTETATNKLYTTLENNATDGRFTALLPTNSEYTLSVNEKDYRTRQILIKKELYDNCELIARDFNLLSIKTERYAQANDIVILKDEPPLLAQAKPNTNQVRPVKSKPVEEEVIATTQRAEPTIEKLSAEQAAEKRLAQLTIEDSLKNNRDAAQIAINQTAEAATVPVDSLQPTSRVVVVPVNNKTSAKPTDELLNLVIIIKDVETDSTLRQATLTLTDTEQKTTYEAIFSTSAKGYLTQIKPHTNLQIYATASGYTAEEAKVKDIQTDKRLVLKILKIKPSLLKVRVSDLASGTLLSNAVLTITSKTSSQKQELPLPSGQIELTYEKSDAIELSASAQGYTSVSKSLVIETASAGKIYEFEAKLDRITFTLKTSAINLQTREKITNAAFRLLNKKNNANLALTTNHETGDATTPLEGVGEYELFCEARGYTSKSQVLTIDKEQNEVVFKLSLLPKKAIPIPISIVDQYTNEPIGAELNVKGAVVSNLSPPLLNATEGQEVEMSVKAPNYLAFTHKFLASDTTHKPLVIRLVKTSYDFVFRTLSEKNRKPVLDADVVLMTADTKQRVVSETTYDKTTVALLPQKEYIILVKADGFQSYQVLFKPQEALKNNTLKRDLLLAPVEVSAPPFEIANVPQVIESKSFGKIEKGKAIVLNNIYFDQSSPVLRPESFKELDELVEILKQNVGVRIEIRGHTDNIGDFDLNVKLSRDRCQSVLEYLNQKGIQSQRIQTVGRGPLDPVAPNTTEDNRKKNRRVEFVVL